MFRSIRKLPAAHWLTYQHGVVSTGKYWHLSFQESGRASRPVGEVVEELDALLAESVRIRLMSEVPLGVFLSGGLDSSVVVAYAHKAGLRPLKTFTIGFDRPEWDESGDAQVVADHFKTDHHVLRLNEADLKAHLPETVVSLVRHFDEPFGDSSILPTYYVSCLARQHVTVVLSGDGGDEIFAGYDRYSIHSARKIFERVPRWMRDLYRDQVIPRLPQSMHGRRFSYNVSLPWRERYIDSISFAFERDMPLLSDGFRETLQRFGKPEDVMLRYFAQAPGQDPISQMLYVDTKTYMVSDILTKVDRMSMATSLEVRVPILDHLFVEWVTGLPPEWKMRGKKQKYIFGHLAERVGV